MNKYNDNTYHGRRQKFFQGGANRNLCHKSSVNCQFLEMFEKYEKKMAKLTPQTSRIVAILACKKLICRRRRKIC